MAIQATQEKYNSTTSNTGSQLLSAISQLLGYGQECAAKTGEITSQHAMKNSYITYIHDTLITIHVISERVGCK